MGKLMTTPKESSSISRAVKEGKNQSSQATKLVKRIQYPSMEIFPPKNLMKERKEVSKRLKILAAADPCWADKSRHATYMQIKHSGLAEGWWCDFINRMERRRNRNMRKSITGPAAEQHPQPKLDLEALKGAGGTRIPLDPPKDI